MNEEYKEDRYLERLVVPIFNGLLAHGVHRDMAVDEAYRLAELLVSHRPKTIQWDE